MKMLSHRNEITREQFVLFLRHDQGLSIVEYAISAGLVIATIAVSFTVLGATIDAIIVTVMAFM
jgi:Flp pilus assembly pilin Flp